MPRKNAGKTKQPSRNPAGRGDAMYPGDKKQHLFFITNDAKDTAKTLAEFAGVSQGAFVETLIRRHGPDLAAVLKLEGQQNAPTDGGVAATGEPVGGAGVPADGARSTD